MLLYQKKESIRDILDKGGEFYSSPEALSQVLADRDDIGRDDIGRDNIGKDGASIGSAGKDIGGHADQCLVLEQIQAEWRAQLDRLARLGFDITYADTHMFPERRISGLKEALRSWCQEKGLIDHRYFYHVLPHIDEVSKEEGLFEHVLAGLADGQYFYLSHPAYPSEDMYLTGNREVSTQDLVRDREADYRFVVSEDTLRLCSEYGVKLIRYDEALPGDYESAETWLGGGK